MVKIKFLGKFREITGEKEIEINHEGTLDELLVILTERYSSEFAESLFNEDGEIKDYMKLLINGEDPNSLGEYLMHEKDELVIFQTIAGG
ncbi:MoaD/ThiS family protein [Methanobacterium alcaliphilum]|uniref:MoaD/ThiS family protein n=1 Tax=Methanobacterium alcaliphilum TaxID=392018 RepID=UPI00200A60B1|nr:MoaD/ThiS family protein [Methanobacterium alcaliphilum]MCK9150679.1 MoaD/ThiS family protein [Methanobacterium alcaliphilum]